MRPKCCVCFDKFSCKDNSCTKPLPVVTYSVLRVSKNHPTGGGGGGPFKCPTTQRLHQSDGRLTAFSFAKDDYVLNSDVIKLREANVQNAEKAVRS
ncbi:hypothetical protein SERLA73DRAFT_174676 [Serpula lacrymans var. lacrymans S7.3]|uniref:Uncharacterized protein n=1 Tax=Serpula lacrymans var. lacrymans (strain S7.3) TaxID=936435 RepID=F8PJL3_SERL3|nr:hypothetical protein SERLA73DRAFT_174676 [Serpula lacrymans var. lacrymans S7.3]